MLSLVVFRDLDEQMEEVKRRRRGVVDGDGEEGEVKYGGKRHGR
jgi:hypothetical protein